MGGLCLFATDLHGDEPRYRALCRTIVEAEPAIVFLGGDLLPHGAGPEFVETSLAPRFEEVRVRLGDAYPNVLLILGNDDVRLAEAPVERGESDGLWRYAHLRRLEARGAVIYGCGFVPPTPFRLKDFERYDVSRYVDPGCLSPEDGALSVHVEPAELRHTTITSALGVLAGDDDLSQAILLLHAPPYGGALDHAALDGHLVDHAPVDPHVGSIAVRRFLEARQPRLALCGHVHESARLTGAWQERIGRTLVLSAAHDGPELCLVRFPLEQPQAAVRDLLSVS